MTSLTKDSSSSTETTTTEPRRLYKATGSPREVYRPRWGYIIVSYVLLLGLIAFSEYMLTQPHASGNWQAGIIVPSVAAVFLTVLLVAWLSDNNESIRLGYVTGTNFFGRSRTISPSRLVVKWSVSVYTTMGTDRDRDRILYWGPAVKKRNLWFGGEKFAKEVALALLDTVRKQQGKADAKHELPIPFTIPGN